ncbi:SH3 domain-containing protein [Streptomyces noursei]
MSVSKRARRSLVVGAVAAAGLMVGTASASAMPAPDPGVSRSTSNVQAGAVSTVNVDGLRLRAAPGLDAWTKGLLYSGDKVFVRTTFADDYEPHWVEVVLWRQSAGGLPYRARGWVWKGYLS